LADLVSHRLPVLSLNLPFSFCPLPALDGQLFPYAFTFSSTNCRCWDTRHRAMSAMSVRHCTFARPEQVRQFTLQSLATVLYACLSLSSSTVHLPHVQSSGRCWRRRHDAISCRHYSAEIANLVLAHHAVPLPQHLVFVCPFTRSSIRPADTRHLLRRLLRSTGTSTAMSFNSWRRALEPHPSTSCLCLPSKLTA
jgi:hypothetical protein